MPPPPLYGGDGIYRSPRPPLILPQDPNTNIISFLFRNLSTFSQTPALIDAESNTTLTFSNLKTHVTKLSNILLNNLKISKDDVVLILYPNSILFPVAFLAVAAVGAVAAPANTQYTTNELGKQIKHCRPKLIITTQQLYGKIKAFDLPCFFLTPDFLEKDSIFTNPTSDIDEIKHPLMTQSDLAALLYSSGTTGNSKGVMLTHKNFIAAALAATSDCEANGEINNVFLLFLPMFHIFALSALLYAGLQRGDTIVVMERFDMEKVLGFIERYRVNKLYAVPPVVKALVKQPEVVRRYNVSSLREIGSAAAPLGKEIMEECAKLFPSAAVIQFYGLTETCAGVSMETAKDSIRHSGSSGYLVPGFESQIIDIHTLKPLPPFGKGEIWVRGPNVMKGYFKNPKATAETLDEQGWFHTGDLGYFDDKGRLFIVDRLKDIIKCKGFQVAPAELEELLVAHPGIIDAAVLPLPDARDGEVPIAFVVRSPNNPLISEEDVKKYIAEQVAPYKKLRRVTFVGSIPKSAAGKILKRELKQTFLSKL